MPTLVLPDHARLEKSGPNWQIWALVSSSVTGAPVLKLRRWVLAPRACTPLSTHTTVQERFFYVIKGAGTVTVNNERHPLAQESIVWIEPGDQWSFNAGPQGLELLEAIAPETITPDQEALDE